MPVIPQCHLRKKKENRLLRICDREQEQKRVRYVEVATGVILWIDDRLDVEVCLCVCEDGHDAGGKVEEGVVVMTLEAVDEKQKESRFRWGQHD